VSGVRVVLVSGMRVVDGMGRVGRYGGAGIVGTVCTVAGLS
jgi:hypothetical protein